MALSVTAIANVDDVVIAWKTDRKIPHCLGFALQRSAAGEDPVYLTTEVPFRGSPVPAAGTAEPSTVWPIQRFVWTDHNAPSKLAGRYTVVAMVGTETDLVPGESGMSEAVTRQSGSSPGYTFFPNRGVVAAPWIERALQAVIDASPAPKPTASNVLASAIAETGNPIREELAGPVLDALRTQFSQAADADEDLYLALYELRDDELIELLIAGGPRIHLILANGSFSPANPDPNKPAADRLEAAGIDVTRRLVSSGHFAHNKFIVFTRAGAPTRVWTGSTNWTPTGLCTQSNNAIVVDDAQLASGYLAYWNRLKSAGSNYPAGLAATDSAATTAGNPATRAWFAPVTDYVDLADARALIGAAEQGALFLMFRPGNTDTLVDDLEALHTRGLFIRGVVNDDFLGTNTAPTIKFFDSQANVTGGDPELILPDHLRNPVGPFEAEVGVQGVLIHSKVIVLDPFGDHPVVMTGSHNLGQKASRMNDDNLLIVQGQSGLAAEYAVYTMNVYDHYKWRYERGVRAAAGAGAGAAAPAAPAAAPHHAPWNGLSTTDAWQSPPYLAAAAAQAKFWFGG